MTDATSEVPALSPSLPDETVAALKDLIPEAFRDGALDVEALLARLGSDPSQADADDERPYVFAWSGLARARSEAMAPTAATLQPDRDSSLDWDTTRNALICGDNLQVLKILLCGYRQAARLIYIDPPYNTNSTFTYSDKYAIPEPDYLLASGQTDENGDALTSRTENGGRKHAPWLTMMLPRLVLARQLLRREGAIVVAIDDNEVHHARQLLDGVFGEGNFLGSFVWEGGRKNDARYVSAGHDYMLCYARDKAYLVSEDMRWMVEKEGADRILEEVDRLREEHGDDYKAMEDGLREWYGGLPKGDPVGSHDYYEYVDERGVYYLGDISSPNYRENLVYEWKGYDPPGNGWRYERDTMEEKEAEGRIWFAPEGSTRRPAVKRYLHENPTEVLSSVFYRDRRAATRGVGALLGDDGIFDNPKDLGVLGKIIDATTDDGDLILDFFAGSGSTGHAVWDQCRKDKKRRAFVMVQAAEETAEKSAARKAGYSTVWDILLARVSAAAERLREGEISEDEDIGFRVFKAAPSGIRPLPPISSNDELDGEEYVQQAVALHDQELRIEGVTDEQLLWEVLLKATHHDLSSRIEPHQDLDQVFEVGEGSPRTVAVMREEINEELLDALGLEADDVLICAKQAMTDSVVLTATQRCQLVVIERVPSEVSL